jgi:hypothetical protein
MFTSLGAIVQLFLFMNAETSIAYAMTKQVVKNKMPMILDLGEYLLCAQKKL